MPAPQHVVEDSRWGTPCLAYNLQIDPSTAALTALAQLQQSLAGCGLPLRLSPVDSLHISVYAIVPFHWDAPDKEAYWRRIGPARLGGLHALCAGRARTSLRFTQLRVTSRAVIVTGHDDTGLLGALRQRLRELADPVVPTPEYDLVHTTVARFAAQATLDDEVRSRVEALPVSFAFEVTSLRVVRELVYPSLRLETVARIPLREG